MCIKGAEDPEEAVQVVKELPTLNKLVLSYLIRFLQVRFSKREIIAYYINQIMHGKEVEKINSYGQNHFRESQNSCDFVHFVNLPHRVFQKH